MSDIQTQHVESNIHTHIPKKYNPYPKRFIHRIEKNKYVERIITIYYEYDRQTKRLKYGATIFKKDANTTKEVFNKKEHNKTALNRCQKKPIIIDNFEDVNGNLKNFEDKIRKMLYQYGVKSKNH